MRSSQDFPETRREERSINSFQKKGLSHSSLGRCYARVSGIVVPFVSPYPIKPVNGLFVLFFIPTSTRMGCQIKLGAKCERMFYLDRFVVGNHQPMRRLGSDGGCKPGN
jgi:hypothetical protein